MAEASAPGRPILKFSSRARLLACAAVAGIGIGVASSELRVGRPSTREAIEHKPWTTSKLVGSPDPPPPYRAVNAFPKLSFKNPVLVTHAPGTDRLFVAEHHGKIFSFPNSADAAKADLFVDLRSELRSLAKTPGATGIDAIYGFCFHPRFAENRTCFVCYTVFKKDANTLADGTRVSRFTVTKDDPPRLDVASEEIVLTFMQGGHNGGDLHFGPDGFLYVSSGDGSNPNPPDRLKTGQDCSDLLSSILRIDVNHTDEGKCYAVPRDNPFVGQEGVRPEIWAFGFRNPWRMSFDRRTGDLWVGDVGWELWELVHRVQKGGNYGWSVVEGRQPVNTSQKAGPGPILSPLIELPHTAAASVTGGYVYRGKKFPDLVGAYLFGDWETRRLWAARVDGTRVVSMPELTEPTVRIVAFGEDAAGELYLLDYDAGTIHTLAKNEEGTAKPSEFPRKLSQTGLFASVRSHTLAEGVVPFAVNAPMWEDGATAERFVALPNSTKVVWFPQRVSVPGSIFARQFEFPANAVLGRTVSSESEPGSAASRKRLETQLLHFDGKQWRGYTYAWNAGQTDADLVPAEGGESGVAVDDPTHPGGKTSQTRPFGSRAQCAVCHNPWAEHTLAFNVPQLNRVVGTAAGRANQLSAFASLGLLARVDKGGEPLPPPSAAEVANFPALADPFDPTAPTDSRARSYLHANCSHCHRFGGGGSVDLELHAFADLGTTKTLGLGPARGGFDLPDPKVIAPGEPHRSVLLYRMAKFGRGRMPHLGSEVPDPHGVALIQEWIRGLPGGPPNALPPVDLPGLTEAELHKVLAAPGPALDAAARYGRLPADARSRILAAARQVPAGPARDLFEGYFPVEGTERKLGTNPLARSILAVEGDPGRGRELYFSNRVQCQACHKLDGKGADIGPDLSAIGKLRTRDDILESLLDPSRRVEPAYQAYRVQTADGRSFTGLISERDAGGLVVKDSQANSIRIPTGDLESVRPGPMSLMPTGTLADLTRQQAADLLAYLVSRR